MLIVLASMIADAYIESNSPEFEAILLTCSEQRNNNLYLHILRFVHKKKRKSSSPKQSSLLAKCEIPHHHPNQKS